MNNKEKLAKDIIKLAKCLLAEDDNPWGWYGGDIIKHTEKNIDSVKKTLQIAGLPEGYKNSLKRTLKNLQDDLKEYKSLARKASSKKALDKDKQKKFKMLTLLNKAMSLMPGSPEQKKLINELNKHRKDFGLKPLTASAIQAKSGVVLINDLWNDEKYFTRRGMNSTERSVVDSVNKLDDVITMGKIIGVPVQFWKSQDRADFRKHGLDSKFKIASKVAARGDVDDLLDDILYGVEELEDEGSEAQDAVHEVIWNIDDIMNKITGHPNGRKLGRLLKLLRKELDEVWQDLENDEPTTTGRARRIVKKIEDARD